MNMLSKLKSVGYTPEFEDNDRSEDAQSERLPNAEASDKEATAAPSAAQPVVDNIDRVTAERDLRMLYATERAMVRKSVDYTPLPGTQRQDPTAVRNWLRDHVQHIPFGKDASPDDYGPNTLRNGRVPRPNPLADALAATARTTAGHRRTAQQEEIELAMLRFLIRRIEENGLCRYVFPETGKLAFTEQGGELTFADDIDVEAIRGGIERARELGWKSLKMTGTPEFMSAVYIEAARIGMSIDDYEPTPADIQRLSVLGVEPPPRAPAETSTNQILGSSNMPLRSPRANIPQIG